MSGKQHTYECTVTWTGNRGTGTSGYRDYERAHDVGGPHGKPVIPGSSDPAFRGEPSRWNPEELLVASLAQCHMLFFLHRAADAGVVVVDYTDTPTGEMHEDDQGGGSFTRVTLRPRVTVASADMEPQCVALHDRAHTECYIASSVNFAVTHESSTTTPA